MFAQTSIMPSTTPAIALLLCDTPLPAVVAEHGDYTTIFNALLTVTVPIRNPEGPAPFRLDSFDVVNKMEYPSDDDLDQYDAIMMTGSGASAACLVLCWTASYMSLSCLCLCQ